MFKIKYKIAYSKIHGSGVFAEENILKGSIIWEPDKDGQEISQQEFDQKSPAEKEKISFYGFKSKNTGKYYYSVGDIHFINHSDDGNSTERIAMDSGEGIMFAKRGIKKGEEITQDYREFESEEDTKRRGIL